MWVMLSSREMANWILRTDLFKELNTKLQEDAPLIPMKVIHCVYLQEKAPQAFLHVSISSR